ncbi:MAG: mechanosensitive ion channel domain-containing protein [Gammaproteobacteria bacterium]
MNCFTGTTHGDGINRRHAGHLILATIIFLLSAGWAGAEEPETTVPLLLPIPLSDIPSRASTERSSLDQAEALLARAAVFDRIEAELLGGEQAITRGLVSLRPSLEAASSRQAISEIEKIWNERDRQMKDTESMLHERTGVIQQQLIRLDASLEVWKKTLEEARDAKAPEELMSLARTTADEIGKMHASLRQLQNRVLALQGKIGRARGGIQEALDRIKAEEISLLGNLMRRERPSLWSEAIAGVSMQDLGTRARQEFSGWWSDIIAVVSGESDRLGFQLLLLMAAAIILHRARRAARSWAEADPSIAAGMSVFERPVALATLLALMLTPWLYMSASPAVADAAGLILVLPLLWLVLPLLDAPFRPALFILAALYVVDWLRDLVEAAPLVARLIFILEMVVAIVLVVWLIHSKALLGDKQQKSASRWPGFVRLCLSGALFLLIISMLASVTGHVRLAVLIGYGVLNSAYLALLLTAVVQAAEAIIALTLHSRFGQSVNVIRGRSGELRGRIRNWIEKIAVVIWLLVTLDLFALLDSVLAVAGGILFSELHAGAIVLSLADVLVFIVTITAAVLLARCIILVLDEDIYPRVQLGRGVSFAISAVIKYGIILLGFLLAVGAMGIGMDRIAILLGAFGVGLGFGLQTIVNNFVSGMILIFERPVQIGDSVEVGSVKGRIKRIGIRSSTVRSFDGADITVPNGSLLSDALTNWTMTDRNRRIEIKVGVSYGTDPDKVIEALNSALAGQEGLLKEPAAQVIFNGFGDNSLDFELRAWVADNDDFVAIRSAVALAMNRALSEYGIEVPFPQRDLHLRSISPDVRLPGAV